MIEVIDAHANATLLAKSIDIDCRDADRAEWVAASGMGTHTSLMATLSDPAIEAYAACFHGHPLLAFGATPWPGQPRRGYAWLIATSMAERKALSLHKALMPYLGKLHETYPHLIAVSDARNALHHRWLTWLGFGYTGVEAVGPWRLPFLRFDHYSTREP